MNNQYNQRISLILGFLLFIFYSTLCQSNCEVSLEDLKGTYTGDCKKGLANGVGIAKGKDTFEGEFKKGLPHGNGTYTWSNGNLYIGEFKKGLRDGKGTFIVQLPGGEKKEQTGFWSEDEYLGENANPYELQYKTPEVLSVRAQKKEGNANENALYIEIQHKGRVQQNANFTLNLTTGTLLSRTREGTTTKVIISQFPFGFTLSYLGETVEMVFNQETSWNLTLDFNK